MIAGNVNYRYELRLSIPLITKDGIERSVEGVIDTGFSGYLSLPTRLIREYGLQWQRRGQAVVADGRIGDFELYHAVVALDGRTKRITVYAIEGIPLLGMRPFVDFDLRARIQVGGRVELSRLV